MFRNVNHWLTDADHHILVGLSRVRKRSRPRRQAGTRRLNFLRREASRRIVRKPRLLAACASAAGAIKPVTIRASKILF